MLNNSVSEQLIGVKGIGLKRASFFNQKQKELPNEIISLRKSQRDHLFKKKRKIYHKILITISMDIDKKYCFNEQIQKSKFSNYINSFMSNDRNTKFRGLVNLRKLIDLESTRKIDEQLEKQGIINEIMSLIDCDDIEFQYEALNFFLIFSSKKKNNLNLFSKIESKINSNFFKIQNIALMIICNLTYSVEVNTIGLHQIVLNLANILKLSDYISLKLLALNSLYNLFINEKIGKSILVTVFNQIEIIIEFVTILIKISNQNSSEIELLSFIYPILTIIIPIYQNKIAYLLYDKTFLETIISSLYIPINEMRYNILRLIYNLIKNSEFTQIDVLFTTKFAYILSEHLDSENKDIQKEGCKILSYMVGISKSVKSIIIESPLYKIIIKNLRQFNQNSQYFLKILNNFLCNIEKSTFNFFINEGILEKLIRFIDGKCLNSLEIILDILCLSVNYDKFFNYNTKIKSYLNNLEFRSKLDRVLFHENKQINEKAIELVELLVINH